MARIKMHIPKAKLPFYPPYEVKYRLQNGVSTHLYNFSYLYFVIHVLYSEDFSQFVEFRFLFKRFFLRVFFLWSINSF